MRIVQNYEELLEYAYECLDRSKVAEPLELKADFDYTVTVKGKLWDQYIDWRLANFVIDMQKAVNKAFKQAEISLSKEEQIGVTVKFKVSKGSSLVEIKFNELLQIAANHMTGGQITAVLIVSILVTGGYLTVKRILARQEAAEDEKTKRDLAKVIENVATYEAPFRRLTHKLDNEDSVTISSRQEDFSKEDLKQEYPGRSKSKSKNVYLDGIYTIVAIKLDAGTITVEQGEHRLECLSSLNQDEAEKLFSKVKDAHGAGKGFDLPLKITADFFQGSKQIKKPIIYEIGDPRAGSTTINDLVNMAS